MPVSVQPAYDAPVLMIMAWFCAFSGLIDCHVHVTAVPGVKTMSELVQTSEELIHLRTTYILRGEGKSRYDTGRILTWHAFRDAPARLHDSQRYRYAYTPNGGAGSHCYVAGGASKALAGAISEGLIAGPRLFQCGKALSQTGARTLRLR